MKTLFAALCVVGQLAVLAFMAAEREYILRTGETIYLRTAPVDPRDVFRGDYVRLDYEAARIRKEQWRGSPGVKRLEKGRRVYAKLRLLPGGLAEVDYLSDTMPAGPPYLAGRMTYTVSLDSAIQLLPVKFGIERYFLEQGKGREIENRLRNREGVQIPMKVELALSDNGTAVIRGHRWSRLGIGLEILRRPAPRRGDGSAPEPSQPASPKVRLTLRNVSSEPLSVVNPGADCGFELVPAEWSPRDYRQVERGCAAAAGAIGQTHLLQPGHDYAVDIDLSEPMWHVSTGKRTGEIGEVAEWNRFRLVYRSPDTYSPSTVRTDDRVWRGRLPSRAFNARGSVD